MQHKLLFNILKFKPESLNSHFRFGKSSAYFFNQTCISRPCGVILSQSNRHLTSNAFETNDSENKNTNDQGKSYGKKAFAIGTFFASALGFGGYTLLEENKNKKLSFNPKKLLDKGLVAASSGEPGEIRKGLPNFTAADISKHNSRENGIWVYYKNGVYDITKYASMHPGGTKILMAAGRSIEPFWDVYSVHKNPEIFGMLEELRIGNILDPPVRETAGRDDPYRNDPERSAVLIPSSEKPFNAEPPPQILIEKFITPNDFFFVRNHLPVPKIDENKFFLKLNLGRNQTAISIKDLKTCIPKKTYAAVTQCAGNRRSEMVKIKPVKGLNWGTAAISNAEWSGVTLNDLIHYFGSDIDKTKKKYIIFEGTDTQPDGSPYGASIPIELAQLLKDDILIAYEMNGEEIPRDHGYPLRVIIPGVVGARQVKWLSSIYLSDEESKSHWQRRDYKGFNSSIDWHNVDFDKSMSISQLPVISAICDPVEGENFDAGQETITVKGYAWSGGGRGIIRVDVSGDGGVTWVEATLEPNGQSLYKSWAWTLWEAEVPVPTKAKDTVLVAKAIDVSYNVQPDNVEGIWNLRGVLSNAWHRVNISLR